MLFLVLDKKIYIPGNYDDSWAFAPGDKELCTECLCKGICKSKISCTSLEKTKSVQFEILDKNQMKLMNLH